jgi:ATP-dependent DNA helicase 2 subunit 1
MSPDAHDDWNRIDNEDDELQDSDYFNSQKDVILFCIDCSESMQEYYNDPLDEDRRTCHLLTALEAAVQMQKKKAISSPNDLTGILLFNTVRIKLAKIEGCQLLMHCILGTTGAK